MLNKIPKRAIFLDRDGVLNEERGTYTFRVAHFNILPGVIQSLKSMKSAGFIPIVVTNQGGIAKGVYTREQMQSCHDYLQQKSEQCIDDFYYAPGHPDYSESLSRKPNSLMFERAIAKHKIDPQRSFMVGDRDRDLIPARNLGIKTVLVGTVRSGYSDILVSSLEEFVNDYLE